MLKPLRSGHKAEIKTTGTRNKPEALLLRIHPQHQPDGTASSHGKKGDPTDKWANFGTVASASYELEREVGTLLPRFCAGGLQISGLAPEPSSSGIPRRNAL